jgi:hypothetical protein
MRPSFRRQAILFVMFALVVTLVVIRFVHFLLTVDMPSRHALESERLCPGEQWTLVYISGWRCVEGQQVQNPVINMTERLTTEINLHYTAVYQDFSMAYNTLIPAIVLLFFAAMCIV